MGIEYARGRLEKGTLTCPKCYSVKGEPCRQKGPEGWEFRDRIHRPRRRLQILEMPEWIEVIVAGKLLGMTPDATRAAIEEGKFPAPVITVVRRRVVRREALLKAMKLR